MLNYIHADYKRILTRRPHIVLMILFETIFVGYILYTWNKAAGNFTSVSFLTSANTFFGFWFQFVVCLVVFIQTFNFDFRAKTIQVALGLGISRLKVILSKLIQVILVMLTDFIVTLVVLYILSFAMGIYLNFQQIGYLFLTGMGVISLVSCSIALLMPLIFRTQNMVLALIGYFILVPGFISSLVRILTYLGPDFLQNLQLERFFHDSVINLATTNAIQGAFQLWPILFAIGWFALGIYLTWLAFRKMELDF